MAIAALAFAVALLSFTGCSNNEVIGKDTDDVPTYKNPDASVNDRVEDLLGRMTLAEKVGQMAQPDQDFLESDEDITKYYLGSVLSGGSSDPPSNSPEAWTNMYERYQKMAMKTRLQIPLVYGVDAVHGHSNVIGAVIFPHNIGLGATRNPSLVEEVSKITAREVAGTGITWTFAPCVAVPRDERWGRTYEGYSEDPALVGELGAASVRGLQGDFSETGNIISCTKHYVGDGGTVGGQDQGDTQVSEQELRDVHLVPYRDAIEAGTKTIMASYSSWNGEKLHGHAYLMNDILKGELGFQGFIISDYRAIDQLEGTYKEQIVKSINAGIDMVMIPDRFKEFISLLTESVEEGAISEERIDDAVTRILRVKVESGLFEHPFVDPSLSAEIGSDAHRQVARQAVRESMVLLKNEGDVLPLSKDIGRIHVAGKNADDIGNQCGGWTIDWQGGSGNITVGTTILEGIRQVAGEGTEVTYSRDGDGADGADVGIVVIGETPYAEGEGDTQSLALSSLDGQALNNVRSAGIPMVVVLVSGRPMIIGRELNNWDAFLAAWLPGTEGAGVADVIFGDYNPTGKLSYTWPRTMEQIPINVGDDNINPLFPYGYGLSY
ncbi:MAG: glycoside hydrolase family 3 C-terminal domain-containing protein [Candidatus Marinimicrobia bacterium]|nr:glycoside hydrolase family 3 C-terminal domain-containing protein [Candidatus Neomarinimicrobiota bacterium]MCF7829553.1 glycoside hydrolase family 3 C-terminal domain-containing protein [Candidatus Neomarinimicrobiota bacterium]MCF7882003.1 glycoside hydrolase family 3 C-terminal domain-containing protein [Candidatus Neomarinimicrobiota bacterium]